MQRLATITLPAKAKTVTNVLAGIVDSLGSDRLYVTLRSDGLAVYTDSEGYNGLVPGRQERRQLK